MVALARQDWMGLRRVLPQLLRATGNVDEAERLLRQVYENEKNDCRLHIYLFIFRCFGGGSLGCLSVSCVGCSGLGSVTADNCSDRYTWTIHLRKLLQIW